MNKYRTIWISDIHLGSPNCQAEKLLAFLKDNESEYLILVGDIIDFWALKRNRYWPETHNTVLQKIMRKARHGTKVVYIPGNHDHRMRDYDGFVLGNIQIRDEYLHDLANGRQMICLHGDQFDVVTKYHKWIAVLGDVGYTALVALNRLLNRFRTAFNMKPWSLSAYVKDSVKTLVNVISDYKESFTVYSKSLGLRDIICGHIHHAEISISDGITYYNCGDWVESLTAIVEDLNGDIRKIHYE